MQAFKFAFETVMIGALALPWLVLIVYLVHPDLLTASPKRGLKGLLSRIPVPRELRAPMIGIAAFTFAYLAGSAIMPVASEFLDDKDLLGLVLPTAEAIQKRVYTAINEGQKRELAAYRGIAYVSYTAPPQADSPAAGSHEDFLLRESALMLRGTDACERLNRLHERLAVLSGAAFNSFVLLLVCAFGWCATIRASVASKVVRWAAFVPASSVIGLASAYGIEDLIRRDIMDMPILEALLFCLGVFGLYVTLRGTKCNVRLHAWTCAFALFFTVLSYGGYACTEVTYDEDVYASSVAVRYLPASVTAPVRSDGPED